MYVARNDQGQLVVRLEDGEDFKSQLESLDIKAGTLVSGIGMLREATLAYWNGEEYVQHTVDSPAELLALQGNFSLKEGASFVHCHVTLGHEDGSVEGGHLMDATVNVTNEIVIQELPGMAMDRQPEAGLWGLFPEES